MLDGLVPVLGAQVTGLEHLGVNLTGRVHALLEAFDALVFGVVAALAVLAPVVEPGQHEGDEDRAHHHDERAERDRQERGEAQASRVMAGFFNDAEGLQAHRQEDSALQQEGCGLPVLLRETPVHG